jgi:hypothetical protein
LQQYLAELEQANPVAEQALVSTTDPDALLATKGGETAHLAILPGASVNFSTTEAMTAIELQRQQRSSPSAV